MRFLLLTLPVLLLGTSKSSVAQIGSGSESIPPLVAEKCAGCHPTPRPGAMPRHAWPKINRSMELMMREVGLPITANEVAAITDFYVRNSPTQLAPIPDDLADSLLDFEQKTLGPVRLEDRPQVTSLKLYDLDGDGEAHDLIVTDNNLSAVTWLREEGGTWKESILARIPAPVNTTPFDLEGDGDIDLAVSAMGIMHPNDELIGEFHFLVNQGDGTFEQKTLLQGVPRITDCAPADFDGDGDLDFVLAMFGWRDTGAISLLRQGENGEFELEEIFRVNGCMRVLVNEVNEDGSADFVALVTQQHEAILQFVNQGEGTFDHHVISRANHPAFGSSSIALHDLDQDGDEDILFTNGDMMDENPEPKPYHGVRWLENTGDGGYALHYLAGMPGCYDAKPIDMDGDGDLDIVYAALYFQWDLNDFPSLAWMENKGGFRDFTRRRISYAPTNLANIAVGDINGDGKPDIVGGGMHVPGPTDRKGRLTAWIQR